ncbi:hypothetical protein B1R32_106120 [Abditibacterium utsteinense]|uniref:Uncharacterized protein n=1 Tax=Abditibacterium utsteinense TaxID=1960156 RepID=A0A2S8STZ2_9BACT|nr:hypothetical protein [Abditibacterium utsteinense]PQV64274.1 hypothetical protein B1R32_106120 [Abditibacterium utsteinense]
MITIILDNEMNEFVTRRYNTNSFDQATIWLVDDWIGGKIKWDAEFTNEAFSPEWLQKYGYPQEDCLPEIDLETKIVSYRWFWCDGESEHVVDGQFIKSAPIEDGEWPTMGTS